MNLKEHVIPAVLTLVAVFIALTIYGKFAKKYVEKA